MDSLLAIPIVRGHLGSWVAVFVHKVFFCYSGYFPRIESPQWNYLVKGYEHRIISWHMSTGNSCILNSTWYMKFDSSSVTGYVKNCFKRLAYMVVLNHIQWQCHSLDKGRALELLVSREPLAFLKGNGLWISWHPKERPSSPNIQDFLKFCL